MLSAATQLHAALTSITVEDAFPAFAVFFFAAMAALPRLAVCLLQDPQT